MTTRRLWSSINELDEHQLRLQVVVPVLRATSGITSVTDVHGQNERGLDVIFFTDSGVERLCYGLQLKTGNISGGGTTGRTVKQIVDQLELASDFPHPVATSNAGEFQIDRFVVATSGSISEAARSEIAKRLKRIPVLFWDGNELIRRIHAHLPQFFRVSDGAAAAYLDEVLRRYDLLDALDQIPGVARRTLSQVFEEPGLRRRFDPSISADGASHSGDGAIPALSLLGQRHNAVVIGDQDSGKTTILRMLAILQARALCDGGTVTVRTLPILVRARDVLSNGFSVVDAAKAELTRLGGKDLVETLEGDLIAGNYFLGVDGFSGMTKLEDKELTAARLEEFSEQYPNVVVIATGRPADFLSPRFFSHFHHYTIEEFDQKQTASLAKRWIGDSASFADVTEKMINRLRESLQLPGSPIPATIGVMLHDEQKRFITNTAEAIDRYMVIRLGRYAHELDMKQEVDWAKKQDLLAEVAFEMVSNDQTSISIAEFVSKIDATQVRQGDSPCGNKVMDELVGTGVLSHEGTQLQFFRTSFRDFFAGHHIAQRGDLDSFAVANIANRGWAGPSVFAAGLRRKNSALLNKMSAVVAQRRALIVGNPDDDYLYAAYLTGRVLANSESSDHGPKVAALRTCLAAVSESIPELEEKMVEHFGNVGRLISLIGAEQTLFVTVGVPWLKNQLVELLGSPELDESQRFLLASTYTHLGYADSFEVLQRAIAGVKTTRVLVAMRVLLSQLLKTRKVDGTEESAVSKMLVTLRKRLRGRDKQVHELFELKSQALKVERTRLQRVFKKTKDKRTR